MTRIIIILMLFSSSLFSQNLDTTKSKRFLIGISYSPDYCYRLVKATSFDKDTQRLLKWREKSEVPKIGYTVGMSFIFRITKRIAIESGIMHSNKGFKTIKQEIVPEFVFNGMTYPKKYLTTTYNLYYLDIPIKVNYNIINRKFKLAVNIGGSVNVLLKQKIDYFIEFPDTPTTNHSYNRIDNTGFSKINFAMIAGIGISYDLGRLLNLKIEPSYRRSISSINKDTGYISNITASPFIKYYLYSYGVNIGLYYKF